MRTDELEQRLGDNVRAVRIANRLTQAELADRANISLGAVRHSKEKGATTTTLVKVLRALDREGWLDALAPTSPFNPLDLLDARHKQNRRIHQPQRVRRRVTPRELPTHRCRRGARLGRAGRRRRARPRQRVVRLCLHTDWIDPGFELSPLHMPLRVEPYEFPDLGRSPSTDCRRCWPMRCPTRSATPWSTRGWPSRESRRTITPLDRLAYAADRAMGALEFRPPARAPGQTANRSAAGRPRPGRSGTVSGEFAATRPRTPPCSSSSRSGRVRGAPEPRRWSRSTPRRTRSARPTPRRGLRAVADQARRRGRPAMDGHGDRLGESAPYGRIEYAYCLMARAAGWR